MSAEKIAELERRVTSLEVEVHVQFKEVFTRIKRIEAILIGTSGAIILLLLKIATNL